MLCNIIFDMVNIPDTTNHSEHNGGLNLKI